MVNGMKNDKLDALIMLSAHVLAEKNAEEFLSTDTSDVVVPKSLDRRIKRMINRERRKQEYGKLYTALRNVAAGFLIACTVTLALVMSVEAVRTALWETIVQWFDDYISIMHVTEDEVPTTIEKKMEPSEYPEEWEREVVAEKEKFISIRYRKDGETMVTYHQGLLNKDNLWIDNDNAKITNVEVNDCDGLLIQYEDNPSLFLEWSDGMYSFSLATDGETDEVASELLIAIAESVK